MFTHTKQSYLRVSSFTIYSDYFNSFYKFLSYSTAVLNSIVGENIQSWLV
jgi:hypothetical protein